MDFQVNFCHQRAGAINHVELSLGRFFTDGGRDPVRREDQVAAGRDITKIIGEDHAALAQPRHDMLVVDNLMPDIERCAINLQRDLHNLNCPIHSRTEAARTRQKNVHGSNCIA